MVQHIQLISPTLYVSFHLPLPLSGVDQGLWLISFLFFQVSFSIIIFPPLISSFRLCLYGPTLFFVLFFWFRFVFFPKLLF